MMKQIEELHKKHNIFPEYKDFHLAYSQDLKTKQWEFVGYRCMKCMKLFKRDTTVPNHFKNCKEINTVRKYKVVEIDPTAKVKDKTGKLWQPLDFNQNLTDEQ